MKAIHFKNILAGILFVLMIVTVMSIGVNAIYIENAGMFDGVSPRTGNGNGGTGNGNGDGGGIGDGIGDAVDSLIPDAGEGTTVGDDSDNPGVITTDDGSLTTTDPTGTTDGAGNGNGNDDGGNTLMTVIGILIAVIAVVAVLVIVFAIAPKKKDGGNRGSGNKH